MSVGACGVVTSARRHSFINEPKLSYVLVPKGRREAGQEKATAASVTTALHPTGFRTVVVVRDHVKYQGAEKDAGKSHCNEELFGGRAIHIPEV